MVCLKFQTQLWDVNSTTKIFLQDVIYIAF